MHRAAWRGWDAPSRNLCQNLRRAGLKQQPGVVSFGYFSLDKQRKARRPPVRELASTLPVAVATHKNQQRLDIAHRLGGRAAGPHHRHRVCDRGPSCRRRARQHYGFRIGYRQWRRLVRRTDDHYQYRHRHAVSSP
jgi:hypothetical protein